MNISSGTQTSMKELADLIAELIGYQGRIEWDSSKPDGQMVKIFDTTKMEKMGLSCPTSLREGLSRTIAWFEANYDKRGDGIRL